MMDSLPAFALTLILITIIGLRYRISPFFTLIGGALFFGALVGMSPDQMIHGITTGIGRVFATFGIIILSGAVIAKILQEQGQIDQIVADIRRYATNPPVLSGLSAYILAIPVTCSITAFVLLTPVIGSLESDEGRKKILLYLAALGSLISFMLIYPTPVIIPLYSAFAGDLPPFWYDLLAVPISLLLLAGIILVFQARTCRLQNDQVPRGAAALSPEVPDDHLLPDAGFHARAWAPFIAIILAIPAGILLLDLSQASLIQFIMLAGVFVAIVLAQDNARHNGLLQGAKHAGIIIFDICGAGALGYVIVESGFVQTSLAAISSVIPLLAVPFIVAALVQTAQGSRVVTAVICAEILAGSVVATAVHPIPLILMVAAGSCVVSYVTDPYFWLIQRSTGDQISEVVWRYTLPLACIGLVLFAIAAGLELVLFAGS